MADVFISHAESTTLLTRRIADALRALGYTVWWDDELPVHQAFTPIIDAQLRSAKAAVVIWSSDALQSTWVPAEAEIARKAGKLVQVRVDGTDPPLPFGQIQFADLTGWTGDANAPGWRKVIASVHELVNGTPARPAAVVANASAARRSQSTTRRHGIVGAIVALVVAVGSVSIWYLATRAPTVSDRNSTTSRTTNDITADSPFMDRPAIAVLPFENRSDDPKNAIFADGLAEDLITRLSAWRAFPVISRSSSFHYRGDVDIKRMATELNVRYVVLGSVQRTPDRIRVSAQLVDAVSGETVWNQTYDHKATDVFDLQDELSTAIVAPLVGDLTRAEVKRAKRRGTQNIDAWSAWQLGEQHLVRFGRDDIIAARPFFERAIALEPQFAAAHARLSHTLVWEVQFGLASSPEQNLARALESARHAVELDPKDAIAHDALGFALLLSKDTPNGLASAQRAVDLNPSSAEAWSVLGYAKWLTGDPRGCIAANEWSLRLDPYSPLKHGILQNLSDAHWELGEFERGLELAKEIVAMRPDYYWGYIDVALNSVGLGHLDEARSAIIEARRLQPDLSVALIRQRSGITRPETIERHNAALRAAGLD